MKKYPLFLLIIFFAILFAACGKSGSSSAINIQGFKVTDYNGNLIGQSGPADSDWTVMAKLSPAEMALFNFGDTVSLENTGISNVSLTYGFPNPAFTQQLLLIGTGYNAVIKLVIVDRNLKVLSREALRTSGGQQSLVLDLSDRSKFPDHSSVRVYYSLSAKDHPNFVVGYGDTRICSGTNVNDCF